MSIKDLIESIVNKINQEHELEKEQLKLQLNDAFQTELDRLKNKIQTMAQNEDNYKFQKRTIASLTSEISSLTANITNLETRLKQANNEIRQLKQPNFRPAPVNEDKEPVAEKEPVAVKDKEPVAEKASAAEKEPAAQDEEEDKITLNPETPQPEPDLVPVVLRLGSYYWDPETNELYDYVSDELIGQSVGFIKTVKIRNCSYYLDTRDDTFYESSPDNIGAYAGQIVNRKAIFTK
jgi:myosin heavy subunit